MNGGRGYSGSPGGWRGFVAVLRNRGYRYLLTSSFAGWLSKWVSRVAQDWLILELTGSVALVGVATALQFAPALVVGPWAGVAADRYSRRMIVLLASVGSIVALAAITVLSLTGRVEAWHVLVASAALGCSIAVEGPSRVAMLSQVVAPRELSSAISANAISFHSTALLGPIVSGSLVAGWGVSSALVAATILGVAGWAGVALVRARDLRPINRDARGGGMLEAVRFAAGRVPLRRTLILLAAMATFGMTHTVLYAASASAPARDTGSTGYALYAAVGAFGAMLGAVASTVRRGVTVRGIIVTVVIFGVLMIVAGLAGTEALFLVAVAAFSIVRILFGTGSETMSQIATPPEMRGRVSGVYLFVLMGAQSIGNVVVGAIADGAGVAVAFVVAGGVPLVVALAMAAGIWGSRRRRRREG